MEKLKPGTILIATPELRDPYFHRSVVLILEDDTEGTVGLVLNVESEIECAGIMTQFDLHWHHTQRNLLIGGPVDRNTLWILHRDGWTFEHRSLIEGVAHSRTEEALRALCQANAEDMSVFMGYAGWGPKQLQREREEGSWWIAEAHADFLFDTDTTEMWEAALALLGVDASLLWVGDTEAH